jgi:hypothetical protein
MPYKYEHTHTHTHTRCTYPCNNNRHIYKI